MTRQDRLPRISGAKAKESTSENAAQAVRAALAGMGEPLPGWKPAEHVAGLDVADGRLLLALEATPDQAPALEKFCADAARRLEAVPGIADAQVMLTAEREAPPPPEHPAPHRPARLEMPGVKRIVAVASGKGGVGKSTVAANLAIALAARGLKVGIVDLDVFGPSIPHLFGCEDEQPTGTAEGRIYPVERFGIPLMSVGFLVPRDAAVIWRGPMVMGAVEQLFRDVAWGELDVLVADLPPGTGDAQLTLAQKIPLTGAVVVSTPQDLALLDARRGLAMFRKVEVPVLGLIENMSYYVCPECGHREDIFAHGGAQKAAKDLGAPFLGEIPLTMAIRETSDAGEPIVLARPESPQAEAFVRIARALMAQPEMA